VVSILFIAARIAGSKALMWRSLVTVRFCATQDTLNDFLSRTQFIQIRRDTTPEAVPAIPFQPDCLDDWMDN